MSKSVLMLISQNLLFCHVTTYTFLLILCLLHETQSLCLNNEGGCQRCSWDGMNCAVCEQGFLLLHNFTCQRCDHPNCSICTRAVDFCQKPKLGFKLISPNTIVPCNVSNCDVCQNSVDECQICKDGYIPSAAFDVCRRCTNSLCKTCRRGDRLLCLTCLSGYYLQSQQCWPCNILNCKECTQTQCLQCEPYFGLVNSTCQPCYHRACIKCDGNTNQCGSCSIKFGICPNPIHLTCQPCRNSLCADCSRDVNVCQLCPNQDYIGMNSTGQCVSCLDPNCRRCLNDYSQCTKCNIGYFLSYTLNETSGQRTAWCITCEEGRYYHQYFNQDLGYINVSCILCQNSPSHCQNCSQLNAKSCVSCPVGRYIKELYDNISGILVNICEQCPENCNECFEAVPGQLQCLICEFGYNKYQGKCYKCGNLLTQGDQQCDSELDQQFDGCDESCRVEQDFICQNYYPGNETIGSKCSFSGVFELQYIDAESDGKQFSMQVKIHPALHIFQLTSPEQLLKLFTITSMKLMAEAVVYDLQTGSLRFSGVILQQLSTGQEISVQYNPLSHSAELRQYYMYGLNQNLTIIIQKYLYWESDLEYWTIDRIINYMSYASTAGWLVLTLGIFMRRLAGLEALFVLQIGYLSFLHFNGHAILHMYRSLWPLKYSVGYNYPFFQSQQPFKQSISYSWVKLGMFQMSSKMIINNFNLGLILQIFVFVALIIATVIVRRIKEAKNQKQQQNSNQGQTHKKIDTQQREQQMIEKNSPKNNNNKPISQQSKRINQLEKFGQKGWQILMTVCLANLVNFIACLILYVSDLQVQLQTPLQIGLNMGVICVKLVISVSVAVKFVRDPVVFDYFRFSFNERQLAMNHYLLHILSLLLIVIFVCAGKFSQMSWVPLVPVGLMLFYTALYRPYKQLPQNIRSCFNHLVIAMTLFFRVYLQYMCTPQQFNSRTTKIYYYACFILLVPVTIIVSLVSMIYYYHYNRSQAKQNNEQQSKQKIQLLHQLVLLNPNEPRQNIAKTTVFREIIRQGMNLVNETNLANLNSGQQPSPCKQIQRGTNLAHMKAKIPKTNIGANLNAWLKNTYKGKGNRNQGINKRMSGDEENPNRYRPQTSALNIQLMNINAQQPDGQKLRECKKMVEGQKIRNKKIDKSSIMQVKHIYHQDGSLNGEMDIQRTQYSHPDQTDQQQSFSNGIQQPKDAHLNAECKHRENRQLTHGQSIIEKSKYQCPNKVSGNTRIYKDKDKGWCQMPIQASIGLNQPKLNAKTQTNNKLDLKAELLNKHRQSPNFSEYFNKNVPSSHNTSTNYCEHNNADSTPEGPGIPPVKWEQRRKQMAKNIVKNQQGYINLESAIKITEQQMKTKNDGHLLNEYDMIDANFRIENTNHKDSDSLNAGLNQGSCEQSSYRNAKGKRV